MSTVGEFEEQLRQFTDRLEGLDAAIHRYFTQEVDNMHRRVPVRTGELKRSIQLTGDRFGYTIKMLPYGAYQNYGVMGTRSSRIPLNPTDGPLTIGGVTVPEGYRFQFGTGNNDNGGRRWGAYYTGIRAQTFFSLTDLTNGLIQTIRDNTEF